MFSVQDFRPQIREDQLLAAQGVPAAKMQPGSPMWRVAATALKTGCRLIQPWLHYSVFQVQKATSEYLQLKGGQPLPSPVLAEYLADAETLLVAAATLGDDLDRAIALAFQENDPALGMALDTFGSLAIEDLAAQFSHAFAAQAAKEGRFTSTAISPGVSGWEISTAQATLFSLLGVDPDKIRLSSSSMMQPQKSLTWVMGISSRPLWQGNQCDLCSFGGHCTFACQGESA